MRTVWKSTYLKVYEVQQFHWQIIKVINKLNLYIWAYKINNKNINLICRCYHAYQRGQSSKKLNSFMERSSSIKRLCLSVFLPPSIFSLLCRYSFFLGGGAKRSNLPDYAPGQGQELRKVIIPPLYVSFQGRND